MPCSPTRARHPPWPASRSTSASPPAGRPSRTSAASWSCGRPAPGTRSSPPTRTTASPAPRARHAPRPRPGAQGRHPPPLRHARGWCVDRLGRCCRTSSRAMQELRGAGVGPVPPPTGARHDHARRQGDVRDAGRVRRVRSGDHQGAGERRPRPRQGARQEARPAAGRRHRRGPHPRAAPARPGIKASPSSSAWAWAPSSGSTGR